jgi:hypothetical protein
VSIETEGYSRAEVLCASFAIELLLKPLVEPFGSQILAVLPQERIQGYHYVNLYHRDYRHGEHSASPVWPVQRLLGSLLSHAIA